MIENGERVDVMVARAATSPTGVVLEFESAWARRRDISITPETSIAIPSIADLITTKEWGGRPKDLIDIQYLEVLKRSGVA